MMDLDKETLEQLGWGNPTEAVTRALGQRASNEVARVKTWRAKNPGWWRKEAWRKSEAGKAASRRAGAKYRAKLRARRKAS